MDRMEIDPPLSLLNLCHLEKVVVKQLTSNSPKTPTTFVVKSPEGKVIFKVEEDKQVVSDTKPKESPFDVRCYDYGWNEVMSFHRSVSTPNIVETVVCGQLTNVVHFGGKNPEFLIKDVFGSSEPLLRVKTPDLKCIQCDYHIFTQTRNEQQKVGVISKKCSGVFRELFTTCDKYEIHFPRPLDVDLKAALLCNCILIDYLHHE